MEEFKLNSQIEDKGQRLDKFLAVQLVKTQPEISRSRIKTLIEEGKVSNAALQKPITDCSYKVKGDEEFVINIPEPKICDVLPKEIDFEIVFEDENMLVINKPAGLTTHPGNGNQEDTLVNALLFYLGDNLSSINGVMRPGIVHRLDKDTSGLMVVAKNDIAHKELSQQIQDRVLERNYLAVCFGVPKPFSGVINKNIGRSKVNRLKMIVVKSGGKKAVTNYEVKKLYCESALSLVECKLDTGRTHQIRVHMTAIGHALVGDQTYGSRKKSLSKVDPQIREFVNNFPRQALHSYKIAFFHPISGEEMEFEIDLPNDMKQLVKKIS